MFRSVRVKNWKLTVFSIACFLIFLTVCLMALRAAPPDTVEADGEKIGLKISSDEDIEAFLDRCGCSAEGCVSDEEITVPKTWNDTYSDYNEMQKQQGFDLRPYKGKTARKLVYALNNGRFATLLVTDDRIIAADVSTVREGADPQPLL